MLRCKKDIAMHNGKLYMAFGAQPTQVRRSFFGNGTGKDTTMSKIAAKTSEVSEFPAFDASKAADQIRTFAEKGVEQSKETYAKMKAGAEDAQKALEATFETAKSAGTDLSLKAVAALRANAEADFAHFEALIGVKSVSDLIELQTSYLRRRVELAVEQTRDLQGFTAKAAENVVKPMKDVFEKTFKELKVA
jgi:phasin